jgi:glutaredoxin
MSTTSGPVTVYWRPGCGYCTRLRLSLRRAGIPADEVNIWEDADGAAFVRSAAGGNETVPTVTVGDRTLVNPQPRRLVASIAAQYPDLVGTATGAGRAPAWAAVAQWTVIAALIVLSFAMDALGRGALSWAADGVAVVTYLGLRAIRARSLG